MAIVPNLARQTNHVDSSYNSPNRTTAADPNAVLTPQYSGEIVLDTANKKLWKAENLTNTSWVTITAHIAPL